MSTRGIVIVPGVRLLKDGFTKTRELANQEVRFCALYWDMLDVPVSPLAGIIQNDVDGFEALAAEGYVQQTVLSIGPTKGRLGHMLDVAQLAAFQENNKANPGAWTLGWSGPHLHMSPEGSFPTRAIEVELLEAIRIPLADVPMNKIIEFKRKRRDQLAKYRRAIGEMYMDIIGYRTVIQK